MAGVVTLMADYFIGGSGVGVAASKIGHFITNPRKKVKLASIANDLSGRASLKKRRFGLWKKVSNLTNLRRIKIFEHFITNLRKKVKPSSIANDHGGRASLKKRRFGLWRKASELTNIRRIKKNLYKKERFELLKKVSELSIQCSFRDGVIMSSLENNEPMVWPSPEEAQ
ncbi:hypothetical protein Goshw_014522 [Gossypium schwendimanii]|uniref:MADS-box domain-containing protein n=1 Tax=Gossypium schwendimanii TaxID=34291 RepID=A0A7J9KS67_GOSSC|nr:hypothetical protein [Gossypium schwendimanii]